MTRWISERTISYGGSALAVALAVALASAAAEAAHRLLNVVNLSLVYLIVVVAVATVWGLGPALLASLLAVLALDLLFIPPFGTLAVANPDDWLTLLFFLAIAALTGRLAAGARARAEEARRRERVTTVLYDLSTALITEDDLAVILPGIALRVARTFGLDACHILLPDAGGELQVVAAHGPWRDNGGLGARAILSRVLRDGQAAAVYEPAGDTPARSRIVRRHGAAWSTLYVPLIVGGSVVGVLRAGRGGGPSFGDEERRLLTTFAHQAALAIDKARQAERADVERIRAASLEEADRVKTALLSSVSHDLRSPLASIKTAVTGLLEPGAGLDGVGRAELLYAIDAETDRLTRLVADLLDLSRIQHGMLRPRAEWLDVAEVVAAVVDHLAPRRPAHALVVRAPDDLPLVPADYVRLEQVVSNLVENAAAYAAADTTITVTVEEHAGGVLLRVRDEGPGIPVDERERVFEPFYRGRAAEGPRPGSGLGLAICRGIVDAHGGWIRVEDTMGPGASVAVWLPRGSARPGALAAMAR